MSDRSPSNPMVTLMKGFCVLTAFLSALGFVLAFTVDPDAINMAVGCLITLPFIAWGTWMMHKIDRM